MDVTLTPFGRLETKLESLPAVAIDQEAEFKVSLREAIRISPIEAPARRERAGVDRPEDSTAAPAEVRGGEPVEEHAQTPIVQRPEARPEQKEESEPVEVRVPTQGGRLGPRNILATKEAPEPDKKSQESEAASPPSPTPKARPTPVTAVDPLPPATQKAGTPANKSMVSAPAGRHRAGVRSKIVKSSPVRSKDAMNRVELARDHRDSIFRSITLALSKGHSEVLLLLDPPELGALGIRLKMEGNTLTLQLGAERKEVAMILRRHGEQLRQLLANEGLNVKDIHVQTDSRQDQHRQELEFRRQRNEWNQPSFGTEHAEQDRESTTARVPLRSGSGIDFLV